MCPLTLFLLHCSPTALNLLFNTKFLAFWWVLYILEVICNPIQVTHNTVLLLFLPFVFLPHYIFAAVICVPVLQNNLAEVAELQADLMEEALLEHILSLLQDPQVDIEVRYFAGGILAHLASRPEAWTLDDELHSTVLKQLVCVCVLDAGFHVKSTVGSFQYVFLSCSITP